ncbi:MAG: NAD-dependent epimerase/dehydratase family protein [Planctomycetes bacterium]|nr:NAD-dependent epimerase/dehydratase family protein [Planctomycetota bacterium]
MTILITGSGGLIGAESARFFCGKGYDVVGIDNDMRKYFFGHDASTEWSRKELESDFDNYKHIDADIREEKAMNAIFQENDIELIIHTAAQPSHDWAAQEPFTDFSVNAQGTLCLLEATRKYHPQAPFIFTSTNKVYGDTPNFLPLHEEENRWEIDSSHQYTQGIDETMSVDQCKHSLFGVSKLAADVMVQEYGKYFGLKTMTFRGGCLTGPMHSGAELHGFLAYLTKCILTGKEYRIFGYNGKQVRDNIHSSDLVNCFYYAFKAPRSGEVYNIGGSRHSNISMREAIAKIESYTGKKANVSYLDENRIGDHIWYISDVSKFQNHFPEWKYAYDSDHILQDIIEGASKRL